MKHKTPAQKLADKIYFRRLTVFGLMFLSTILATLKWITVMPTDSVLFTKIVLIGLFFLTFAWISLFFWSSLFGFFDLWFKRPVPGIKWPGDSTPVSGKTAILMPVYNEDSSSVFANLAAIAEDLKNQGAAEYFDIFVLSDSTNPQCWVEEEKIWLAARRLISPEIGLYYRRRAKNTARKSGNIEDFCRKWGSAYDFMVVLDADSLMSGKTIVQMVKLMEVNPGAGIIQAPPMMINSHSLFARMQQFAGRVYGPIVSSGLAYWQVGDSNYWGHNAIIRVKAFMQCCSLPVLPGHAPFGGHILSHDFVEAALIRRGGWSAWLLPQLRGSYEECPPTMIDFAARDRRWCQGNLQHIKVLLSKHLHPVSRVHFIIGIMSYLSSLIWLSFLLTGLLIALGRWVFPPIYFPEVRTLFPTWPIFDKIGTISLFVLSMAMLIMPKFMGMIIYKRQNPQMSGTLKSVLCEILVSALQAPVMMMFQSKFVLDILTGHAVSWNTQNRGDNGTSWREALRRHFGHTFLGIATTVIVALYAKELFWWMLPITTGLMLSVPLSVLTSRVTTGRKALEHNFFVIPEEKKIPPLVNRQKYFEKLLQAEKTPEKGVVLLIGNPALLALHRLMLPVNGPAPEFDKHVLEAAQIKLENYVNHHIRPEFSKDEEIALLYQPDILTRTSVSLFL